MQLAGELQSLTPVGLDPATRLAEDQRGHNDLAEMAKLGHLTVQRVPDRSSLVAEVKPCMPLLQLGEQQVHAPRPNADLAEVAHFACQPSSVAAPVCGALATSSPTKTAVC